MSQLRTPSRIRRNKEILGGRDIGNNYDNDAASGLWCRVSGRVRTSGH